jgi:hypothetical protein
VDLLQTSRGVIPVRRAVAERVDFLISSP